MASAFLGKYASITVVDLIQRKKLDFRNFNVTEARFNCLLFCWNNENSLTSETVQPAPVQIRLGYSAVVNYVDVAQRLVCGV